MTDLEAIRGRHERDKNAGALPEREYVYRWEDAHVDRAALLAEVDRLNAYADKLAAGLPVGMLPKDVELVKAANAEMAADIHRLQALCHRANKMLDKLDKGHGCHARREACDVASLSAELREAAK